MFLILYLCFMLHHYSGILVWDLQRLLMVTLRYA